VAVIPARSPLVTAPSLPSLEPGWSRMVTQIEDMSLVGHSCAVPVSDEQLWEVTAAWLAGGLAAGERVVHFGDETAGAVLGRMADDGVAVRRVLDDGRLVIVPTEQTRAAATRPVGRYEELFVDQIDRAAAQGFTGLRLAGECGSELLRAGGVDRVVEYERVVDRVLREYPTARLLCRYDRPRFDEAAVSQMRALHETELVGHAIYDDSLLRITRSGPAAARLAGEVDHSNRPQIRKLLETVLDQALRSHSAPSDITLDLSSLRFLDVAGAVSLVHAAEEFPSTHRLVLTGVRPRVARVLDRCGAPFAAQLDVRARSGQHRRGRHQGPG
jgi:anti-anti-sigma factor